MPKLDATTQRARRENILDAAERCFARQGFHHTSMQDICREAGVSPGALYLYFNSKEDLIAGICEREKTVLATALASIAEAPDFMAALGQLAQTYCVEEPPEKLRLHVEINAEALRNPAVGDFIRSIDAFVIASFERLIAGARDRGRIDPAYEPGQIAAMISIIGDGIYLRRAMDPDFNVKAIMPVILSLVSSLIRPVDEAKIEARDRSEIAR
ncbi:MULTISPECIES: TetR/AcrR family transcriptional regulator [Rhodomicrobium]|uniref:TetR/AcrR family transcriptional regulator n=1 Tax=Rhodomicrobium TaxID=1068 RepID=UPI000B4C18D2|nr:MULTISPECIES: TetR/AcrR family transcriptional regulator [Rhodomicrobium]